MDETIYIDNNKNISNKSRSSKSTIFQNEKNEFNHNNQIHLQKQQLDTNLQFKTTSSTNTQQQADNTSSHLMLISQQVLHGLILHYKQLLIKSLKNMTLHHQIAIMQQ